MRRFLEERQDLKARPDLMARIAQAGNGVVLGREPAREIAAHFREHLAAAGRRACDI